VDRTRPYKSLSLFINHQPTNVLIGSNSAARRRKSYSDAPLPPRIAVCIDSQPPRSDWTSESCLNDESTIGSPAEWAKGIRHKRASGTENQLVPTDEIEKLIYLRG